MLPRLKKLVVTLFSVTLILACGESKKKSTAIPETCTENCNPQTQQIATNEDKPQITPISLFGMKPVSDNHSLTQKDQTITGTGSIISSLPLPGIKSANHFMVSFLLKENESVTVHSYATKTLQKGVNIKIERKPDNKFVATLLAEGVNADISEEFSEALSKDIDGPITLRFDMHNDETGGHLLAWVNPKDDNLTKNNALLNEIVGQQGSGNFWGITLDKATVIYAKNSSPKVQH